MSSDDLVADLTARGVTIVATSGRLRFHPMSLITSDDLHQLQLNKQAILNYVQSDENERMNPFARITPSSRCDLCSSPEFLEVSIHDGESLRRECARCGRFMGWPLWYGAAN